MEKFIVLQFSYRNKTLINQIEKANQEARSSQNSRKTRVKKG